MGNTSAGAVGCAVVFVSFLGTMAVVTEEIKAAAVRVGNVLAARYGEDADVEMGSKFKTVMTSRYKSNYQNAFVRRGGGWTGSNGCVQVMLNAAWTCRYSYRGDIELSMKYTAILEKNANDNGYHVQEVKRNFLSDYVLDEDCKDEGQNEVKNELADVVRRLVGDELKNLQKIAATKSVAVTSETTGKANGERTPTTKKI